MVQVSLQTPEIAAFIHAAKKFCAFVEDGVRSQKGAEVEPGLRVLVDLYRAGVDLPECSPSNAEFDESAPHLDSKNWPGFQDYDYYWTCFDAFSIYKTEEPTMGSLIDDIVDIYNDVKPPLRLLEEGTTILVVDIVFEWRNNFEIHWGRHASEAINALHQLVEKERFERLVK